MSQAKHQENHTSTVIISRKYQHIHLTAPLTYQSKLQRVMSCASSTKPTTGLFGAYESFQCNLKQISKIKQLLPRFHVSQALYNILIFVGHISGVQALTVAVAFPGSLQCLCLWQAERRKDHQYLRQLLSPFRCSALNSAK